MAKNILFISCLFLSIINSLIAQQFENVAPLFGINHSVQTQLLFGGHGVSFFDFNNDGWDDITFVQEEDSLVVYLNNQGVLQPYPSMAMGDGETRQAIWVDFDNDGDNDLFVTSTNGTLKIYENDGNMNMTEITANTGVSLFDANNFGVSFADFDRDGYLDFYLARYSVQGSLNNPNHLNALYKNNGDGTFTDVTQTAGVDDSLQPSFMGVWIDVNKDLYPDLYVINDRVLWGNSLYINNGDGTFTDYTTNSGLSMFGEDPMGAMVSDFNNNGHLDILCSNGGMPTKPVRFYVNNGDSTFTENAQALGIHVPDIFMCTWGGSWFDFNNDGFKDLYLATGFLQPAVGEVQNYFFQNINGQGFIHQPHLFQGSHVAASYGVAKGDLDNDGFYDLVVQNAKNFDSYIWKNNAGQSAANRFVKITLEGTVSNKMAIGSWVEIFNGGQIITDYTQLGENFISQDSQHKIYGVNNAVLIDSIRVTYNSGHIDTYYNLPTNQHYFFKEGETLSAQINYAGGLNKCVGDTIDLTLQNNGHAFQWMDGSTSQINGVFQSGSYYANLTSPHGITYPSDTVNLFFHNKPMIVPSYNNPSCHNTHDGTIYLQAYHDLMAPLTQSVVWPDVVHYGFSIANRDSGYHKYIYQNDFGCVVTDSVYLERPAPIAALLNVQYEEGNSYLHFQAFGGTPPFNYFINNLQVLSSPINVVNGNYSFKVVDSRSCQYTDNITVNNVLSVNNLDKNQDFRIYPNPLTSGQNLILEINQDAVLENIVIYNTSGQKVFTSDKNTFYTGQNELIISDLSKGIYFIHCNQVNKQQQVFKLIIH